MKNKKRKFLLFELFRLGKISVILPVSFTAFTGYFLFNPEINLSIFLVSIGVFLQGTAASGLNQVQESLLDSKMERTKSRPIPTGSVNRNQALLFVLISFLAGSFLVYLSGNLMAVLLGVFTLIWYNGIYTPLKKITAFAVIPGSLTGAIPPVIGWTAAGGSFTDPEAILLAFLFFMGQVPHFWLLILKFGDQYRSAGLPNLTDVFSTRQINNLSFIWISASLSGALLLGLFGILQHPVSKIILILITLSGIFMFSGLINNTENMKRKKYFILLNSFYLFLMIILVIDKIIME
ncbi:MAG: protoheme IX farnesyltransferase [Bacteroidales bacterium]